MLEVLIISVIAGLITAAILAAKGAPWNFYKQKQEMTQYLKRVIDSIEHKTTQVIHPIYSRFDLLRHYILPTLTLSNGETKSAEKYLLTRCNSMNDYRLLIHGIFGMGKTALCLYLNYKLAEQAMNMGGKTPIPFYIALRRSNATTVRDIETLFDEFLKEYELTSYKTFRNLVTKKNVVIFLDGFDQMDTSGDLSVPVDLLNLIHAYLDGVRTKVIMTTRTDYFEKNPLLCRAFQEGVLQPSRWAPTTPVQPFEIILINEFDDTQLLAYLAKHPKIPATDLIGLKEMRDKIHANVHLPRLSRHPLLLNMILQTGLHLLTSSNVFNVGDLYHNYMDYWLQHDGHLGDFVSYDQKLVFVRDLALSLLKSGSELGISLDKIKDLEKKHDWMPYHNSLTNLSRTYYDDYTRSFLLVNRDRTLMFAHQSFMEFFCADWAIQHLREHKEIPAQIMERLYSNLIIWFMRYKVNESDYEWIAPMVDHKDIWTRRLAFALLTDFGNSLRKKILKLLEEKWETESDMEAKRHILYGIGCAGGKPCIPKYLKFIEKHLSEWQNAPIVYYHTPGRQREHCIGRLRAFRVGDMRYYANRCLYILDLGEVGVSEDIELIETYTEPAKEKNCEVRRIAFDTLKKIRHRALQI